VVITTVELSNETYISLPLQPSFGLYTPPNIGHPPWALCGAASEAWPDRSRSRGMRYAQDAERACRRESAAPTPLPSPRATSPSQSPHHAAAAPQDYGRDPCPLAPVAVGTSPPVTPAKSGKTPFPKSSPIEHLVVPNPGEGGDFRGDLAVDPATTWPVIHPVGTAPLGSIQVGTAIAASPAAPPGEIYRRRLAQLPC